MPRANRYMQPDCLCHLTHRCHNRRFLMRFARTREEYRKRLRSVIGEFKVSLLAYCITSNHTHLLVKVPEPQVISRMMQKIEGDFAQWYNRRKSRSGAFWSDRYHCTMVDGGEYAWNCMRYIDLNMVRAGVVSHPRQWRWCSYDELSGKRQRYRLVDRQAALESQGLCDWARFKDEYVKAVDRKAEEAWVRRNPIWTESLAVGSAEFTRKIEDRIEGRVRLERVESDDGVWVVREPLVSYTPI